MVGAEGVLAVFLLRERSKKTANFSFTRFWLAAAPDLW